MAGWLAGRRWWRVASDSSDDDGGGYWGDRVGTCGGFFSLRKTPVLDVFRAGPG
jgi:hypothetical protein